MNILIDENLPRKLAAHLQGDKCRTVFECGWSGKKNGELLVLADPQFDVLLTLDKNIPYQLDLKSARIAVLMVRARSNRMQDLLRSFRNALPRWRAFSQDKWFASRSSGLLSD